jgi:hypothetical protein
VPPSPKELRASLVGQLDRRTSADRGERGERRSSSVSSAGGGQRGSVGDVRSGTGSGSDSRRNTGTPPDGSPSLLLPMIGISAGKTVGGDAATAAGDPAQPGTPGTPGTPAPADGKRRRSSYLRRASVEEIQYFTDLLKQSMIADARQVRELEAGTVCW